MLNEVKESILNAYEFKTGLTRERLSHMMDDETWFNAKKAVELGFADKILFSSGETDEEKKKPEKPEKEPEEGSDGEEGKEKEDEDKDKKKKFPFQQDSMMYSTKAMNESFLSRAVSYTHLDVYKRQVHIHIGAQGHTPQSLRNLANIMASHESLIAEALKLDRGRMSRYCRTVDPRFLEQVNRRKPRSMAHLADIWYTSNGASCGRSHHYNDSRYHMLNLQDVYKRQMELDEKYASVILRRAVENGIPPEDIFVERNGAKMMYSDLVNIMVS